MSNNSTLSTNSLEFLNGSTNFATITSTSDGLLTLTSNSGDVTLRGVKDPVNNQDAATKAYVLANSLTTLASAKIFVGNASNVATAVDMTGGATISNTGVVTIQTNANLTGPITSVGNATSVASQTGTGTTFVMNTSPTLVTPVIGAATGTSLSVSGQLTSTVSTGTAPLVVSSTTQVANLTATNTTNTSITNDTSTTSTVYPTWVTATSGNLPQKTTDTKLSFIPAYGYLYAPFFSPDAANTTSLSSPGAGVLDLSTGNSLRLRIDSSGIVQTTNTTDASSSTTGSVKFDGGVGIAKQLFVGKGMFCVNSYSYVVSTGSQTISNSTNTTLTGSYWGTPTIEGDVGAPLTYSAGVWTIGTAGFYTITYTVSFSSNVTGRRAANIATTGSLSTPGIFAYTSTNAVNGDRTGLTGSAVLKLAASDTVSINVFQVALANLNMDTGIRGVFSIYRMG